MKKINFLLFSFLFIVSSDLASSQTSENYQIDGYQTEQGFQKTYGMGSRQPGKLDYRRDYKPVYIKQPKVENGKESQPDQRPSRLYPLRFIVVSNQANVSSAENATNLKYYYSYKGKIYTFFDKSIYDLVKDQPDVYIQKIKEIDVEAYQYGFKPERMTVKRGDIVTIKLTSRDVMHGFFIKELSINIHVDKGEERGVTFIADRPGRYDITCSSYCGSGHQRMKAKLIVRK